MYPRSFLREEAKAKQRSSSKKKLGETGEEATWESPFFNLFLKKSKFRKINVTSFGYLCNKIPRHTEELSG